MYTRFILLSFAAAALAAGQGDYKTAAAGAPSGQLSDPVKQALAGSGVKISDPNGYTFCEVWLRSTPLAEGTSLGDALKGTIPEGALVGAIRYYAPGADANGQGFPTGAYTLRYAGNGMVYVIKAADDPSPDPMSVEQAQKLSKSVSGTGNPATLRFTKGSGTGSRLEITGDGNWVLHLDAGGTPADLQVLGVAKS